MGTTRRPAVWRLLVVAAVVTAGCAPPESVREPVASGLELQRPFEPGGQVQMVLSAGKYTIAGSPEKQISLVAETGNPADRRKVHLSASIDGREAVIRTEGPSNRFAVTIGLPSRSDLIVRLSAGDLTISGLEGHKDVSAWAGDVKIGVARAEDQRSVNASVLAGEISARPFDRSTGGVFRFLSWQGGGQYDLRVRLTAGQVTLRIDK